MKKESKKKIYLTLWVVTGIMLGILVAGIIELIYLKLGNVTNYLFLFVYGLMVTSGFCFGLWAGPVAWQKIYVDGVRGKKYLKP